MANGSMSKQRYMHHRTTMDDDIDPLKLKPINIVCVPGIARRLLSVYQFTKKHNNSARVINGRSLPYITSNTIVSLFLFIKVYPLHVKKKSMYKFPPNPALSKKKQR
jgi:hypothetical protein